jgi:hypothetical protein
MTYSLDCIFLENSDMPPIASIYIKTSTTHKYKGHNELTFITPECMSLPEFNEQVDRLHAELESIRNIVRTKFSGPR